MLNRNTKLIWRRESERGRGTMRWFALKAATCPVTHCEPEFHAHARMAHTSPQPRPGPHSLCSSLGGQAGAPFCSAACHLRAPRGEATPGSR